MVQKGPDGPKMGPKWSKTFRLTILVPFGPFWTTLECWQACHVWPFLVQNGPFLGHPQSWTVRYGSGASFLLIFSARDDLVKVSWKSDARKYQNQHTPPYFDQLSERYQPLSMRNNFVTLDLSQRYIYVLFFGNQSVEQQCDVLLWQNLLKSEVEKIALK